MSSVQAGIEVKNHEKNPIKIDVEVQFIPFPSENERQEAYYTHAKLFLKAKERMLKRDICGK